MTIKHSIILLALFLPLIANSSEPKDISLFLELGDFSKAEAAIKQLKSPQEQQIWHSKAAFYKGDYKEAERIVGAVSNTFDIQDLRNFYSALIEFNKDTVVFESEHFRIRLSGADVILSTYALTALEAGYSKIGESLGYFPKDKILVEVYGTKDEFAVASSLGSKLLEKSGTVGICKFNRVMLLSPQALPIGYRWLDTLNHEYTHFIVNRKSNGLCPLWLHEGIARYHDTLWRLGTPLYMTADGENHLYNARKAGKYITFRQMYPSLVYLETQDDISLAFAEAASAVNFMKIRFGNDIVGSLLQSMADTKNDLRGFKNSLKISQEKFEKEWQKYIAGSELKLRGGAASDQPQFKRFDENEFIGANLKGHIRLGDRLRTNKLYDAAVAEYEKALEKEPANPVVLLKIARAYLGAGNFAEAEKKLRESIEANPNYVTPFQALGELYCNQREYAQAVKILNEAVAINPFHPRSHELLALSYAALGDNDKAALENNILRILSAGHK